jgi:predicted RNase H-like HicB family nuclease
MASSTADGEDEQVGQEIRLVEADDRWIATDVETGVASQGETREAALENLDEGVALYRGDIGEIIETPEEEREALRDMGLNPDEIEAARESDEDLPEFFQ